MTPSSKLRVTSNASGLSKMETLQLLFAKKALGSLGGQSHLSLLKLEHWEQTLELSKRLIYVYLYIGHLGKECENSYKKNIFKPGILQKIFWKRKFRESFKGL